MRSAVDLTAVYPVFRDVSSEAIVEPAFKRLLDRLLASIAIVVSLPLVALIALAIKLDDGGPVFFSQKRWGRHRQPFDVYKFRSMVVDADAAFGPVQAQEHDPRITRVGRILRATALDELPQIFNIWKGDMSWVGPRALPINELQLREANGAVPDEEIPGFDVRCAVRPGLTGIAQIYAPRDVPRGHKFRYDLIYLRNQSVWLDLRLIALSFWITSRASWEHRGRKV